MMFAQERQQRIPLFMSETPKTAILGATGGIGRCLTKRLRAEEHQLFLMARNAEALTALAHDHEAESAALTGSPRSSIEAGLSLAKERMGGLTGIVNCIGSVLLKPAHRTSFDEWSEVIETNLSTAFAVVRAAGQLMRSQGGSVVLVSSVAARHGLANHEAIAAAKAGIEGLVRSAAASYARFGLRFNAVAPGLVETPMTKRLLRTEAARKASEAMVPLGRVGQPRDIASAMAYFLNPENSWVSGQILSVDGGMSTLKPPVLRSV